MRRPGRPAASEGPPQRLLAAEEPAGPGFDTHQPGELFEGVAFAKPQKETDELKAHHLPSHARPILAGPQTRQLPSSCMQLPRHFGASEAAGETAAFLSCSNEVLPEGPPNFLRVEDAPVNSELISPVYRHLLPSDNNECCFGASSSAKPLSAPEGSLERAGGSVGCTDNSSFCCLRRPLEKTAPITSVCGLEPETSHAAAEGQQSEVDVHLPAGAPRDSWSCCEAFKAPQAAAGIVSSAPQGGLDEAKDFEASCGPLRDAEGPPEGPRRPCLVLLDLDNTLIPTGWIMACWRNMQVYFGLQQAVECIRRGLEQAELVGALRSLFDDLRILRKKRHTQIVIVTNAGLRTVQEFYLKICLPELRELCEREKVYIHSTEHFARRVGPIPPMTEEEAFCEFYTALKYHEFDFVVQRYLNALLCQAPIPLQGPLQEEEGGLSPSGAGPSCPEAPSHGEGGPLPPRRSAPPFCKRARLSAQREGPPAAAGDCSSSSSSAAACCEWCDAEKDRMGAPTSECDTEKGPLAGAPFASPPKGCQMAKGAPPPSPPLQQHPSHSCCPCSAATATAAAAAAEKAERKRGAPLSLREQLQAAAAVHALTEAEKKDSSFAPSPSESPRGFDPFPLNWRCDLISAGDQVCEIHAACRVARHFSGHVKFAKLLFLRDPEDPKFLTQTPKRFISQLKELHASLLHVISCDEETLDERGHPRWIRRGDFSQVTIVAPERLEAPPRHCAAARVRHAFEYLRKRRTRTSKTATSTSLRFRQEKTIPQTDFRGEQTGTQGQLADAGRTKHRVLSCPLEWERNAVANPPTTASLCELHEPELSVHLNQQHRQAPDDGQFAVTSESRSVV